MTIKFKTLLAAATVALPTALAAQTMGAPGSQMQPPVQQTPPPAGEQTPPPDEAPDQSTASPDQATPAPSVAGQTGATTPATAADLHSGATVHDTQGGTVGTIESADASGAVINTGAARARLPLTSFARNDSGLVISMTRAQLEAAARPQASPSNPS